LSSQAEARDPETAQCAGSIEAVRRLADGQLVAFPTETYWGLAAAARSEAAVARLFAWKGRAAGAPVAILVSGLSEARELGAEVPAAAARLADAHWPGPLTLVLRCHASLGSGVAAEDGTVGFRCSSHPTAAALARRARSSGIGPITATSLNHSGAAPARTRAEAAALCSDGPALLDCGPDAGGDPASTVVRVVDQEVTVLRNGAIRL
jgi:L-threonylcarbamoyladenylate synthase